MEKLREALRNLGQDFKWDGVLMRFNICKNEVCLLFRSASSSRLCIERNKSWWQLFVSAYIAYCLLEQLWCGIFCFDKTFPWLGGSAATAALSKHLTTVTNFNRSLFSQQVTYQNSYTDIVSYIFLIWYLYCKFWKNVT